MRLSAFERRMAERVARAFLPRGSLGGIADERDLGQRLAYQIERSPWWAASVVRLALWVTWLRPLVTRRPRLFGALSDGEQAGVLESLAASRRYSVREMQTVLKIQVCMAAFGDAAALARFHAYDIALPPAPGRPAPAAHP